MNDNCRDAKSRAFGGGLTSTEMFQFCSAVGIGPKELAHLLGTSVRSIQRGVHDGGTVDVLLRVLRAKLEDPRAARSTRALVIITARSGGLEALLSTALDAYVTLDLVSLR